MAVSPDLLLNIKAAPTASKAANATPKSPVQPSKDGASSFANVYAKERQGKPAEAKSAPAQASRDKPVAEKPSQETDKPSGSATPVTSEPGKNLPADSEQVDVDTDVASVEVEIDPLLLFGMGAMSEVSTDVPIEAEPTSADGFLTALGQPQLPVEGDVEGENEGDTQFMGQRTLDLQSATQKSPIAIQPEPKGEIQDTLSASLVGEQLTEESDEPSLEEGFAELLDNLEAPKENRPSAADAVINRLNPLTQAIAQQVQAQPVQKTPLVPGQPVHIQQSGWTEAVVDRVMWLSSQNLKSAEIQLDPAELGRMEVRIDMNKDQTQVTFMSPHANVRDALEGQMQRLRDSFAQQGMMMDVNVSDQSRGWNGGGNEPRNRTTGNGLAAAEDEVVQGTMEISAGRTGGDRGLVDYYA